ncbi:hypothetical protein FQA47_025151 [Oryzias melastigma]|uniref:Uncharacterized protein n=1 Tax=Oryzias melastigma TaxID=30732 RepID=A0A834CFA2_ORYME|nr:hypothetical protein FQA47_025151 [Oryzias melastigma]
MLPWPPPSVGHRSMGLQVLQNQLFFQSIAFFCLIKSSFPKLVNTASPMGQLEREISGALEADKWRESAVIRQSGSGRGTIAKSGSWLLTPSHKLLIRLTFRDLEEPRLRCNTTAWSSARLTL